MSRVELRCVSSSVRLKVISKGESGCDDDCDSDCGSDSCTASDSNELNSKYRLAGFGQTTISNGNATVEFPLKHMF